MKGIGGPKLVPCDEDTDFLNEFQKLIVDDYQSRRTENVKVPSFDVAVPMQLGKKKPGNEEGNRVNFMVMLKKGNRQQLRDLKVPISSDLAANIREKQQEEQAEQEEVKRLVLDYNQRQEEETYNGRNIKVALTRNMIVTGIEHATLRSAASLRRPVCLHLQWVIPTIDYILIKANCDRNATPGAGCIKK